MTDQASTQATQAIFLTSDELSIVRSALAEYLTMFGHEQGHLVHAIKALLQTLPLVDPTTDGSPGRGSDSTGRLDAATVAPG